MKKIFKIILEILIYSILYIDRFIIAFAPWLSVSRIDLNYKDMIKKRNSLVRVFIFALIISMILCLYWAVFVLIGLCVYYLFSYIKYLKVKRK